MNAPERQIPPERRVFYYVGMALIAGGILLFVTVFFAKPAGVDDPDAFVGRMQSMLYRALGGMVLMVVGGLLMRVGMRGWAGSGMVLDPEQARRDVAPWSRMAGGMAQDALGEVEVVKKLEKHLDASGAEVVKVRCPKCQALNDEADKSCGQCGAAL